MYKNDRIVRTVVFLDLMDGECLFEGDPTLEEKIIFNLKERNEDGGTLYFADKETVEKVGKARPAYCDKTGEELIICTYEYGLKNLTFV